MALQGFLFLCLFGSVLLLVNITHITAENDRKAYIVYMGDKPRNGVQVTPEHHVNILRDIVNINTNNGISHEALLLHSYTRSFHGFSAKLTVQEAKKLAGMNGVVSVFPCKQMKRRTTKSWDFLEFPQRVQDLRLESDVIVGVLDTGIWPESNSFNDNGLGPPPKKWKGKCLSNKNFTCNNKIIGAQSYDPEAESPRDTEGHGTHCASTAAGSIACNASLYGLANGTAGGVPSARIAAYKLCLRDGCEDSGILRAFDDAIDDGVDIISASFGHPFLTDYFEDEFSIGAFHAARKGVFVSTAGGNDGPGKRSISNVAPWALCVASTSINRQYITQVHLGNGKIYEGIMPNVFTPPKGKFYDLIYGGDAPNKTEGAKTAEIDARFCKKGSLDINSAKGKIVLCDRSNVKTAESDGLGVLDAEAAGVIMTGPKIIEDMPDPFQIPAIQVGAEENGYIFKYINTTRNPTATILKSMEIDDVLAPYVPLFSSRGPNPKSPEILNQDLAAPGNLILAAWNQEGNKGEVVEYNLMTGTSMACPHASGAAAYVKSIHPTWSPAAIHSALMTTAKPMSDKTDPGAEFSYGAGLLNPNGAPMAGLVYDRNEQDYINFLCSEGYTDKLLHAVTGDNSQCSSKSNNVSVYDLNYPSFSLPIKDLQSVNGVFHRTVTNVGSSNSTYKANVVAPSGLKITVEPVLSFTSLEQKKSFTVTIKGKIQKAYIVSASLVWDDGTFKVRSPNIVYFKI